MNCFGYLKRCERVILRRNWGFPLAPIGLWLECSDETPVYPLSPSLEDFMENLFNYHISKRSDSKIRYLICRKDRKMDEVLRKR